MWFQNKRCKDKKKAIQAEAARMHQQQALQAGAGNVSGISCTCIGLILGEREGRRRGGGGGEGKKERERREGGRERETLFTIIFAHSPRTLLAVCDSSSNATNSTHAGQHGTDLPTPGNVRLHLPLRP